jgi:hypothetical protein
MNDANIDANKSIFRRKKIKNGIEEEPQQDAKEIKIEDNKVIPPTTDKNNPYGLHNKLTEINEKIDLLSGKKKEDEKKKIKKYFKIPFKVKSKLKKNKDTRIQVILLRHNKGIIPTVGQYNEGIIEVGEKGYDGQGDVIWLWNNKIPTAIIPEWDLYPITRGRLLKEAEEMKRISHPQTVIIRMLALKESLKPKKGFGGAWIWILIGVAVLFYLFFGGGIK